MRNPGEWMSGIACGVHVHTAETEVFPNHLTTAQIAERRCTGSRERKL